jgi:hypothetical protein
MPDSLQPYCRVCRSVCGKTAYKKNPQQTADKLRRLREEKRGFVWDYLKTHPCIDCGEGDPIVLDFDHQGEKRHNVSYLIWSNRSISYIEEEISRCKVRCANCHRRKTAEQFNWYKWKRTHSQSSSLKND